MFTPYGYGAPAAPFNPYMQQTIPSTGMFQNQAQQPAPPAQQPAMPSVIQVATIKQVEQAPVQPGGKALVLVANAPVIAMRVADNMGITTTDYYQITKFDPDAAQPAPEGDFVTRAEFQQAMTNLAQQLRQAAPAPEKEAKA